MPEVTVEIAGRRYRMACEEGQEEHVLALAARFNKSVDGLKGAFGEVGDTRLTVMAGIAVMDELVEAERQIAALRDDLANLTHAGEELGAEFRRAGTALRAPAHGRRPSDRSRGHRDRRDGLA